MVYDPPERNPVKPLKWIVVDSLVIAGIAFVSTLPGNRLPDIFDIYVGLRAFLYSFLIQLAIERGVKVYKTNKISSNVRKTKTAFLQVVSFVFG